MKPDRFHYKKHLGQNFLHNTSKIGQMSALIDPKPEDIIVEIGPGAGALTKQLVEKAGKVIAVEIDVHAIGRLKEKIGEPANLTIVNADFLELDIRPLVQSQITDHKSQIKVVGNIPYYITAPIIEKLIENRDIVSKAWLTVQKEVADRIVATHGSKVYGALSVFCQFYADVKKLLKIDRKSFFPEPDVDSAFISLDFNKLSPIKVKDEKLFFRIERAGFNQRRKMLINNVKRELDISAEKASAAFKEAGINEKARAEEISVLDFAKLSDVLYNTLKKMTND